MKFRNFHCLYLQFIVVCITELFFIFIALLFVYMYVCMYVCMYVDDDMQVDHSDVTASSSKLPYKAAFPPNKAIKKKLWSARFFGFVYLFRHRHVI